MISRYYTVSIALLLSLGYCTHSMSFINVGRNFDNSGTMNVGSSPINVGEVLNNTGKLISQDMLNIRCGTLRGNGYIGAPIINIICKHFEYTGTIECSNKCTVTTSETINQNQFTYLGDGKLNIIINSEL